MDFFLDITDEVCPLTFVKTKLMMERMVPGQTAEIRLKGQEPLRNVPRSAREHGYEVLDLTPEPGADAHGPHRLRLRRG